MCFAQDNLLKWGATLFLRFLGPSRTPVPTDFIGFLKLTPVGEGSPLPICATFVVLFTGDS